MKLGVDETILGVYGLGIETQTKAKQMTNRTDARREQNLKELASNLADMVEAGDLTDTEANEWYNMKADQWAKEA